MPIVFGSPEAKEIRQKDIDVQRQAALAKEMEEQGMDLSKASIDARIEEVKDVLETLELDMADYKRELADLYAIQRSQAGKGAAQLQAAPSPGQA